MSRRLYEYISPNNASLDLYESEEANGEKSMIMSGLFIQGNVKNQNGRVYPDSEIQRAVRSIQEKLQRGDTIFGELDHPTELQINLDRVSHFITELDYQNSNGVGKLKLLDTPMGNIAKSLLKAGGKLGVSSRGSGNVNDSGHVSEFDIVTVDIVATPSAPDAYPKAIYESLFNMRGGAIVHETAAAMTHDPSAEKHLMKAMTAFINELNKR